MSLFPFTLISSQQGSSGYPEDDWQRITKIDNDDCLLQELKKGYLVDARRRNDFPLVSVPIKRVYLKKTNIPTSTTEQLGGYEDENGDYVSGPHDYRYEKTEFNDVDMKYLKDTFKKFERWKTRLQTLIPMIRKRSKDFKRRENELKKLHELATKYNYELIPF